MKLMITNLHKSFSGNKLPQNRDNFSSLCRTSIWTFYYFGGRRAHIIGEHICLKKRLDIQFKGSGQTPYSRNADGRAALGPMLREYLIMSQCTT